MKLDILSIFVEAVGFYEHEHNEHLEEDVSKELLNKLDIFEEKEELTEYEKNTINTIIDIFFLYGEEAKLAKYKLAFIRDSIAYQMSICENEEN